MRPGPATRAASHGECLRLPHSPRFGGDACADRNRILANVRFSARRQAFNLKIPDLEIPNHRFRLAAIAFSGGSVPPCGEDFSEEAATPEFAANAPERVVEKLPQQFTLGNRRVTASSAAIL